MTRRYVIPCLTPCRKSFLGTTARLVPYILPRPERSRSYSVIFARVAHEKLGCRGSLFSIRCILNLKLPSNEETVLLAGWTWIRHNSFKAKNKSSNGPHRSRSHPKNVLRSDFGGLTKPLLKNRSIVRPALCHGGACNLGGVTFALGDRMSRVHGLNNRKICSLGWTSRVSLDECRSCFELTRLDRVRSQRLDSLFRGGWCDGSPICGFPSCWWGRYCPVRRRLGCTRVRTIVRTPKARSQ
jgi:hypothetical protein